MISENDIIIESADVNIFNGDFDISDANNQNIRHLLISNPGDYKAAPIIGASIFMMQNAPINGFQKIVSNIRTSIINDGYRNPVITGEQTDEENSQIQITAERINKPQRISL